jgi:EAL domain-containing protein (putative c-di-GMP-specific phosphodiesterase class I)
MRIGVILDDFGTGTTSLRGLRQFPGDALKIDRPLVRPMQTDRAACGIVRLIAALAQKMTLKAMAAGIESARQVDLLELKCEYGQGYYFSQSRDAKTALQFMGQHVAPTRTLEAAKQNSSKRRQESSTWYRFLRRPLFQTRSLG